MNSLTKVGLMLGGAYALHSVLNKSQASGSILPQEPGTPPYYPPPVVVPASPAPSSSTPVVSGYPAGTFPMAKGSRSAHVAKLQTKLGFTGKDVDGIFGTKTETALKTQVGVTRIANSVDYERIMTTGKPAAPTTPVPAAPTGEKVVVLKGEMNAVFNALFKPVDRVANTYQYLTFIDQDAILAVLEKKSDLYLVHVANYWKGGAWKSHIFFGTAKAARFIRNDLEKGQAEFLRTVAYKALIARFKRLNIA